MLLFLITVRCSLLLFFFFNDTATTEIYTLSLHDALPISRVRLVAAAATGNAGWTASCVPSPTGRSFGCTSSMQSTPPARSEEHTSELQSHLNLVCRLLLEKKKTNHLTLSLQIQSRMHQHS